MQSFLMRTQKLIGLLVILGLFSAQSQAEDFPQRHSKLWKVSAGLLAAVTVADMQSSIGRQEANPLLAGPRGQFSGSGIAIKSLFVGGMIGGQWLLLRKNPQASKFAAGANFAATALTGAIVVHNHMLK